MSSGNLFDLTQLSKVLTELETSQNTLEGWGELSSVLEEIKTNNDLQTKLKEILTWINENPFHTYPKRVSGWINAIKTQFCRDTTITADSIVDNMVRLEILNVSRHTFRAYKTRTFATTRVVINRKRCRAEVVDEEFGPKRMRTDDDP